jgi:hypothetical protein
LRQHGDTPNDRDGDGFDTEWSWVCGLPGFECALEPEVNGVSGVEAGVTGPHVEERLGNALYAETEKS